MVYNMCIHISIFLQHYLSNTVKWRTCLRPQLEPLMTSLEKCNIN